MSTNLEIGSINSHTISQKIELKMDFIDVTCTDWVKHINAKNELVTDNVTVDVNTKESRIGLKYGSLIIINKLQDS